MLLALGHGALAVGRLAAAVGISSSSATYHVRRLCDAGLVGIQRTGRRTVVRRVERKWASMIGALATDE